VEYNNAMGIGFPKVKHLKIKPTKKKAWVACSRYIRLRDAIKTTGTKEMVMCYTCPAVVPIQGRGCAQAGHFIGGRKNVLLFDENQIRAQCYMCNIRRKGNWDAYYRNMVEEFGFEVVQNMIYAKWDIIKYTPQEFLDIEATFISKLQKLSV